jgi:hypothetical protein
MCLTLGASIAEIVSAFPTSGGLYVFNSIIAGSSDPACRYTATAFLVPVKHRARVGWVVGWISVLGMQPRLHQGSIPETAKGQITGASSSEFGLAGMIWAAVVVAKVCIHSRGLLATCRLLLSQPGRQLRCFSRGNRRPLRWPTATPRPARTSHHIPRAPH